MEELQPSSALKLARGRDYGSLERSKCARTQLSQHSDNLNNGDDSAVIKTRLPETALYSHDNIVETKCTFLTIKGVTLTNISV